MSMDEMQDLDRLAPEVDEPASWELFEARRKRDRRRRGGVRVLAGGGLVATVVLLAVLVSQQDDGTQQVQVGTNGEATQSESDSQPLPDEDPSPTTRPPIPEDVPEREIDVSFLAAVETSRWLDEAEVVTDAATLESHWEAHRFDAGEDGLSTDPPPAIDFDHEIGILMTVAQTPCPARLSLEFQDDTLWVIFDDEGIPCHARASTMAYLVVVARDDLPPSFTLRRTHIAADRDDAPAEPITIPDRS